jgi:hypothetical protein
MHRSHSRYAVSTFVILLAILACAMPGQTISPAPVIDPNAISTAVAGTAHAAEQQTQQANSLPPTATIVPTNTMTPQPKVSSAGTSLLNLADGSTQFTDHTAGIQVVFPSLWLVFRVGEPEYYAAWEKPETQNPAFSNIFASIQDNDPKIFRGYAFDVRPGHMPNGIATSIGIVFQVDMRSLEELEQALRNNNLPCEDLKLISSGYQKTNSGLRALVVEKSCRAGGDAGTVYFRYVLFSLPSGTMSLSFETNFEYKDVMLTDFDQVVNSVTILNP